MKRNAKRVLALLLMLVLTAALSGCGSSGAIMESVEAPMMYRADTTDYAAEETVSAAGFSGSAAKKAVKESASIGSQPNLAERTDVKLIYTASFTIQTTDFAGTTLAIRTLVENNGGYFESADTSNGNYNSSYYNYRNAYYTVRIPAENYNAFVTSVGTDFYVSDQNESVQDIGQSYAETESHIATLKIKQERLQDLLRKAEKMEDIIDLESALSDCEYEIEQYSTQLNRYNSLIGYSTVHISVSEVERPSGQPVEKPTFANRIARSFKNACEDFVDGFQDFVIWLVGHIFSLMVWAAVIWLAIRILGRLSNKEKRAARKAARAARAEKKAAKKAAKKADGKNASAVPAGPAQKTDAAALEEAADESPAPKYEEAGFEENGK